MFKLVLLPAARKDITDAYAWYEEQSLGLGKDFAVFIRFKLDIIEHYPERYSIKRGYYRTTVLRKFPYLIVYRFNKTKRIITVTSIYHTKRNPKLKYRK